MDLSVFNDTICVQSQECELHADLETCASLNRLFTCLQYFSSLNVRKERKHKNNLEIFSQKVYKMENLLNDYHHFIKNHSHNLDQIQQHLSQSIPTQICDDMENCQYSNRHHRVILNDNNNNNNINNDVLDPNTSLYIDTLDSLHFYIFHVTQIGLRAIKSNDTEYKTDQVSSDNSYYDTSFARMRDQISSRNHSTKLFDRFPAENKINSKFNININNNELKINKSRDINDGQGTTYLDTIYQHLRQSNIPHNIIQKFISYIDEEEYCTEGVDFDISQDGLNGNISNHVANMDCIQCIIEFMAASRSMLYLFKIYTHCQTFSVIDYYYDCVYIHSVSSSSFSVGVRFYYWFKYKSMENVQDSSEIPNFIDHSGYDIKDLYVKRKYQTLKEEILNYNYINVWHYQHEIAPKAAAYHNTAYARSIKAKFQTSLSDNKVPLYYGIYREKITISHLMSVILYCDYSKLSADFSSTFRKNGAFDTLHNMKARNSRYYWMSKLLRETVEIFGECRNDGLLGPFFSGLSMVISIPNFFLRLYSPTSTSVHIEVAMKFSGDNGIIMKLDNPSGNDQCKFLRGFNCSWISRYKEEDERS